MTRFAAALVGTLVLGTTAHAGVEIGGFAGLHIFSNTNGLGVPDSSVNPMRAMTSQKSSAIFAARLGVFFTDRLGIEIEGGVIPTEPSATVFDVLDIVGRAQLVYKFAPPEKAFVPFAVLGGGFMHVGYTVNSDIIRKETDWMPHVGVGIAYKTGGGWAVRADARLILPPSSQGGITEDYEVLLSLSRAFGDKRPTPVVVEEVKPKPDVDTDGDGIPDSKDKCPTEAEDKDGFQDEDGCPDPDNDGDGIPDAKDKCPNEAEDKDNFQDDDGCPDPDNDGDGIPDVADKCPDQPETKNGYQDEDGCPDEIPAKLKAFTGSIQGINFKTGDATLTAQSSAILDKAVAVLVEFKDIHLEIDGHTDDVPLKSKKFADNMALSQARAESVKAYFVKKGIDEGRIEAKGFGDTVPVEAPTGLTGGKLNAARAKNRRVEFKLIPSGAPVATPPATPATTTPVMPAPAPAPAAPAPAATAPAATAPAAPAKK
ncbi:MAG: OmpA family protein [Kofleriaceae bacterium]